MHSRIASKLLTRANSIRRPNVNALKDTIRDNIVSDGGYQSNEYIHKNFFDDENYHSILKCLDGGYEIATDFIEYMQDYYNLLQSITHRLTSYSNKWKSKLKEQSSLSSYNTTKRAQLQTVRSPENLAQLIQSRCDAIQHVIDTYKKQIDRMYPSEHFGTVHKHYRTDSMKKLFKTAHSTLSKASDKLDDLREQEKKAQAALRDAKIQCQNLELNGTTNERKLSQANDHQEKKENKLQTIQAQINRAEQEYNQEQNNYRENATGIYLQCRVLEEERLNQIRQTLIEFTQAIYTSEYADQQDTIYEELLLNIKGQQDTLNDLDFWARTYHVNILAKSVSSETNQDDDDHENIESQTTTRTTEKSQKKEVTNLATIDENTNQSVAEAEEDQSVADKTGTSAKTKQKKKKNSTPEPTTTNTTGLSQV